MRTNFAELQSAYADYCTSNLPPVTPRPRSGITDLDRKLAKSSEPRSEYEAWRAMAEPVERGAPRDDEGPLDDPLSDIHWEKLMRGLAG